MWRSPRRWRPGRALPEVTSSPGPPAPAIPLRASCGHQAGCPLRALWDPGHPRPLATSAGNAVFPCNNANALITISSICMKKMREAGRAPSPRLWPRHPIRRHILLPRWMRRGRRGEGRSTGGRGHVLEEKPENTRRGEPERQTKKPERHVDWDEREKERQENWG